jgi:hypothetical protein
MNRRILAPAIAAAIVLALAAGFVGEAQAQDSSYQTPVYRERNTGLTKDQGGGTGIQSRRVRTTIAGVNAGATLLPAIQGYKYRLVDAVMIAVGGAVGTCTSVDILGTQATSSVKLVAAAIAALTQSAVVHAGAANAAVLADGASFAQNDASKAITIGKTGGTCDTATHVDVILTYAVE